MYQYPKQILTIEQQVQSYIDGGMEIFLLQFHWLLFSPVTLKAVSVSRYNLQV